MNLSPENKIAGVLAPIFALRREGDLGIGDTAALVDFVKWAAATGFKLVQILPVNETGADNSPYNAISSTALDPATLTTDPDALKDLDEETFLTILEKYDLESMRGRNVDYPKLKELKRQLLWSAFQAFEPKIAKNGGRAKRFAKFRSEHKDWLEDYTLFRLLMEKHGSEQWDLWPENQQTAEQARAWLKKQTPKVRRELERQKLFNAYVQWVAFDQWNDVKKVCDKHGVLLMGDVPIGVSYYSSDVFSRRDIFDLTWSGGAPPEKIFKTDPFIEKWGQNWGVPHYRWDALKEKNYDWWRQRVRTVREVFHIFRIDHILGFYRIYSFPWRPQQNADFLELTHEEAAEKTGGRLPHFLPNDDDTHENREANRRHGESLLRILLEEVDDYSLIGEDLGMVPDYVRPSLASLGIAGFKIPMWETAWDGRLLPGGSYNRLSLATYATHDHEPMHTFWDKWCEKIALHAAGDESLAGEAEEARRQMCNLMDFAHIGHSGEPIPYSDEVREALIGALFKSNSWMTVAMINDYFGTKERFNVPGAVTDFNWSRRLSAPAKDWLGDEILGPKIERISKLISASGR